MSVSKFALIGSLRSRIVIVITLITIAVQLAIYAIVDKSNKEFQQTHQAAMTTRLADIIPVLVGAELKLLDYELLRISNELKKHTQADDSFAQNQLLALAGC